MSVSQVELAPSDAATKAAQTGLKDMPNPDVPNSSAALAEFALTNAERNTIEHLHDAIQSVEAAIAPVWPLKDYVAVNPFLGLSDRPFLNARKLLRSVSDSETLMPLEYFQTKFRQGNFEYNDVQSAVADIAAATKETPLTLEYVLQALSSEQVPSTSMSAQDTDRLLQTIAELASGSCQSESSFHREYHPE